MRPTRPSRAGYGLRVACAVAALCVASSAPLHGQNSPGQGGPAQSQAPEKPVELVTTQRANAQVEKLAKDAMSAAQQAMDTSRQAETAARSAKRLAWSGVV